MMSDLVTEWRSLRDDRAPEGVGLRTERADALARAICAAPAADLQTVAAKLEVVSALLGDSDPYTDGRLTKAVAAIRGDVERLASP